MKVDGSTQIDNSKYVDKNNSTSYKGIKSKLTANRKKLGRQTSVGKVKANASTVIGIVSSKLVSQEIDKCEVRAVLDATDVPKSMEKPTEILSNSDVTANHTSTSNLKKYSVNVVRQDVDVGTNLDPNSATPVLSSTKFVDGTTAAEQHETTSDDESDAQLLNVKCARALTNMGVEVPEALLKTAHEKNVAEKEALEDAHSMSPRTLARFGVDVTLSEDHHLDTSNDETILDALKSEKYDESWIDTSAHQDFVKVSPNMNTTIDDTLSF